MGRRKLSEAEVLRRNKEKEEIRQQKQTAKLINKTKRQNNIFFYRQVVRNYKKKDGTIVTYVYDKVKYSKNKNRAGDVFVDVNGKINKRSIESYKKAIDRLDISESAKNEFKDKLDLAVKKISKSNIEHKDKTNNRKLDANGFTSKNMLVKSPDRSDNTWRRRMYFINQGLSAEQVADEIGCNIDDLLDEKNWSGNRFVNPANGKRYDFKFSYLDDYVTEVI